MAVHITYKLAMAAGRDAANKAMKAAGRTTWDEADFNVAAELVARLMALQTEASHGS